MVKALKKFSNKQIKTKASSPKILPLATCLPYLSILDELKEEEIGRFFEVMIGSQLVRTNKDIHYWREGKYEVDYVLKIGRQIYAIEVKSGEKLKLKGLEKFKNNFPGSKQIILKVDEYSNFEKDPLDYIVKNSF